MPGPLLGSGHPSAPPGRVTLVGDNPLAVLTLAPALQLCPPQPGAELVLLFF